MGKTYEALQWAEKEYKRETQETSLEPVAAAEPPRLEWTHPATEQYEDLKANLLSRYRDASIKTILFTGMAQDDEPSATPANFAAALARDPQLKVLLLDANLKTPGLHAAPTTNAFDDFPDLVTKNDPGKAPVTLGPGNLHVISCLGAPSESVPPFESHRFDRFLKQMRNAHDYVILDAPPIHGSSECRVLCAKVDGVILVIESGKTRRHVALSAKRQVEEAGGKILGVVLNGKRHYIPDFIYRRL